MPKCIICGEEVGVNEIFEGVCYKCHEGYVKCRFTGAYVLKENAVKITETYSEYLAISAIDKALESGSYWKCDDCGKIYIRWRSPRYQTYNGSIICDNCKNKNYRYCNKCGELFYEEDMVYDDWESEWYCVDCDKRRQRRVIKDYSFKPDPKFKVKHHDEFMTDDNIKELLFGVELEIDKGSNVEDCAAEIVDGNDDVYCKHDGSLCEGVEIVTHPCTLNYHIEDMDWGKICRTALDYDFESHYAGTCGLHIHVGRNQLGDFNRNTIDNNIAKIILLMNRHWENMVKFSRRSESQLEEWAELPYVSLDNADEGNLIRKALDTEYNGRYQAVNLQNRSTIEFRLYRGSLKEETILASLELTSNICKYAMSHTVKEVLASQWSDIVNIEEFDELTEYLEAREIYSDYIEPVEVVERKPIVSKGPVLSQEDLQIGDRVVVARADGYERLTIERTLLGLEATVVKIQESYDGDNDVLLNFGKCLDCTHYGQGFDDRYYCWLHHEALDYAE